MEKCTKFLAHLLHLMGETGRKLTMEIREEHQEVISLEDLVPVQINDPMMARTRMSGEFRLMWAVDRKSVV